MAPDVADELAAWLRLLLTPGIGRAGARQLLAAFGTPQAVFEASSAARQDCLGQMIVTDDEPPALPSAMTALQAWLAAAGERDWVALGDARYPKLLLQTADPPLLLYTQGDAELLNSPCVAIVGSRNPTPQGAENARAFAEHLGRAGLTIVSGLALGIDGAAHSGALAGGARTIAVVGTGLDRVYPRAHRELAHRIAERGLIVSEFNLGTEPLAANFPQRNRVIAGLSLGTLVVEAALESGSLITARQAVESGRDVFASPGSIHSPQSRGCHALIKQGAKLVDDARDVLEELRWTPQGAPTAASAAPATAEPPDALLSAMGYEPVEMDQLQARTGWPTAQLSARLLELELAGRVSRLPGGRYQRAGKA
ncbi:MAG TPA: DNA-processing protein DprA [Burkholderiaceae bacterium]|nr:DNA-processing protein DprA [Burkholderiaceae bacterium]